MDRVDVRPVKAPLDRRSMQALRWAGTAVLAGLLLAGAFGRLAFPGLEVAVGLLVAAVALNVVHATARVGDAWLLAGDVLVLGVFFATTGGVANPFTLLFLLPVLAAALVLDRLGTAAITAATIVLFAALYTVSPDHHHMDMSQHLVGMLAAYAITVPVLAAGVHRLRSAIQAAQEERQRAREARLSSERLAALAALAGGAAHELATPLSTILLVARELEAGAAAHQRDDLALIADQVLAARATLSALALDAGGVGVPWRTVDLSGFTTAAVAGSDVVVSATPASVHLPEHLLAQALRRLIGNARDAGATTIAVDAAVHEDQIVFTVRDDGEGMDEHVLRRACEPFFTTRNAGPGRGLGLFFVHSLADQIGGRFVIRSVPGEGTTAVLELPREGA